MYREVANTEYSTFRFESCSVHQYFQPCAVPEYYPAQMKVTSVMLQQFLKSPNEFENHVRQ